MERAEDINTATYTNAEETAIDVVLNDGGQFTGVPNVGGNRHRAMIKEWEDSGNIIADAPPPVVTSNMVNIERDRRIYLPQTVVIDGVSITFDMDNGGRQNISDMANAASILKTLQPDKVFTFRDTANVDHSLSNDEMISVALQIMAKIEAIHASSKVLKNGGSPIASDYTDDRHWT